MAGRKGQRRFGYVRKLKSAKYSASYRDPNGVRRFAPDTFASKPEAVDWLVVQESLMVRGEWTDPDRGKVPFGPYTTGWIAERPGLRPRTVYLYQWTLAKHLEPSFGRVLLSDIDPFDGPSLALSHVGRGRVCLDGGEGVPPASGHPENRRRP